MDPEWVDVFPIENGDVIPASYVSLPEATHSRLENGGPGLSRCMDPIENGDVIPASYVIVEPRGYLFLLYGERDPMRWDFHHQGRSRIKFGQSKKIQVVGQYSRYFPLEI